MSSIPYPNIATLGGEIAAAPEAGIAEAARTRALETQTAGQGLQNQVLQQQLKDQQAMTAAMHEWDGQNLNDLPGLVIKHGASANAVIGLKNSILDQQTKLANLSKDQLANTQAQHTQIANAIAPLTDPKSVADADLPAQIHQVGQGLLQSGTLDPQHEAEIERLSQLAQADPNTARQQLDLHRKAYLGQSALAGIAKDQGQAQEAAAKAHAEDVEASLNQIKLNLAKNATPGSYDQQIDSIYPPNDPQSGGQNRMLKTLLNSALSRGDLDSANKYIDQALQSQQGLQKEISLATNPQVQKSKEQLVYAEANARQQAAQGDPNVAGQMLADGSMTLAELKTRGATPQFLIKATQAAQKIKPGYSASDEVIAEQVAKSPSANQFFGSANSLIQKGGTLDQLEQLGKQIPQHDYPVLNTIDDWQKLARGKGPLAGYAAKVLGVADDYSKVMGGGTGSDSSRDATLKLFSQAASPDQRAQAIAATRDAVLSQRESRIGTNQFLRREYGAEVGGMVKLKAPNGQIKDVPLSQAEHYKSLGATEVQQ